MLSSLSSSLKKHEFTSRPESAMVIIWCEHSFTFTRIAIVEKAAPGRRLKARNKIQMLPLRCYTQSTYEHGRIYLYFRKYFRKGVKRSFLTPTTASAPSKHQNSIFGMSLDAHATHRSKYDGRLRTVNGFSILYMATAYLTHSNAWAWYCRAPATKPRHRN